MAGHGEDEDIFTEHIDTMSDPMIIEDGEDHDELGEEQYAKIQDEQHTQREEMMFSKIHSYLDIYSTMETVITELATHGCTQQVSDDLQLEHITRLLGISSSLPSSLPIHVYDPDTDGVTTNLLSTIDTKVAALDASMESILSVTEDALQGVLENLDPRIRYVKTNAKKVLALNLEEAKLKTQIIRMPDYDSVHDFIPDAVKCITSDATRLRAERLREFTKLGADLTNKDKAYNKLATEYINWYRDTFDKTVVPSNVLASIRENRARRSEYTEKQKAFSDRSKSTVWDSEWYRQRNTVINSGLRVCDVMHYSKTHIFKTLRYTGMSILSKIRPNYMKTKVSDKFVISMSTMLRLAAMDSEWYRFNCKLLNQYLHWCVIRLIFRLNRCATKPLNLGPTPRLSKLDIKKI